MSEVAVDLHGVAERLGVHYQTAYKWVRSGALPAHLVQGRYVIDPAAVEVFAARRRRPRAPRPRRPRAGFATLADRMFWYLTRGDERRAGALVVGLIGDAVSFTTVVQEVLVPALRRVGTEWQGGRLTIADEHRGSAIVERIIGRHRPTPRGRRRGTVVVAALAEDRHALPSSMAAAALREDHWHVHHLGADVPADELVRFCDETPVDVAVLTVTNPSGSEDAERVAVRLKARGVRTLVGRPDSTLPALQQLARGSRT